jgi:hypothetical protein
VTARYPIAFAPALACGADVAMTLLGQPAAYWAGDRSRATDFNPVARALLELHPLAFPVAALVGLILLSIVLVTWPNRRLAYVLAFAVTFAQAVAAAGWLVRYGLLGCIVAAALLLIVERLLVRSSTTR